VVLDQQGTMVARANPRFAIVPEGFEGEERRLRDLSAKWSSDWFLALQKEAAHRFDGPVRVRNVRVFDPRAKALTGPVSVVFHRGKIAAVSPADTPSVPGETTVDGGGGTLVPGLFEMHGHIGEQSALLNTLAGVTTVRDMGSDNPTLDRLVRGIESGALAGPRVIRAGMIEGKSPTNNQSGIIVDSEAAAVDAVRWYASRGYDDIKIYSSINPAWVPAMIREARVHGMGVLGHVPAFTTADAMIDAGYDEITHINQLMLSWVIKPEEDTRTLFRLTGLKRLPALDLNSAPVQATLKRLIDRKVALDPTFVIHEDLTLGRTGETPVGKKDYFEHMPVGWRRGALQALVDASTHEDDAAYRGAFEQITRLLTEAHRRGIMIVPGTDTGGAFTLHRELELYQRIGMTPAEILTRATLDMARHTGRDQTLGSIEKGKAADFFLIPGDPTKDLKAIKTIRMVVQDGVVYFPDEVYPKLGVKPFTTPPKVTPAAEPTSGKR
jgi:imidazolonepropionase-like amidohydrolase